MKGNEVDTFSKAPDWISLLLVRWKLNKIQGAQTKNLTQSSSTFIRILRPITEVKKNPLINEYENIIAYSEESEQEWGVGN